MSPSPVTASSLSLFFWFQSPHPVSGTVSGLMSPVSAVRYCIHSPVYGLRSQVSGLWYAEHVSGLRYPVSSRDL